MILADKIIDLRKKNGWSQEELAEKLGVSRQAISKWEGAQSIPDMNRILAMSDLFGVSTDYLLKDALEPETAPRPAATSDSDFPVRRVSMEEANAFLAAKIYAAGRTAVGVMLCILSPILLIVLCGAQEAGRVALTEQQAAGLGLTALIVLVAAAVALFVLASRRTDAFDALEQECIETEYGVDGMVRERREQYQATHTRLLMLGIVLCVLSVLPIFTAMILDAGDFAMTLAVGLLLALVATGVLLIVRTGIINGAMQALLEEGDYTRESKAENKRNATVAAIYWPAVAAVYLAWSFLSGDWGRTWVIWPVASVAYGIVFAILRMTRREP